jgi:hypothetical protein
MTEEWPLQKGNRMIQTSGRPCIRPRYLPITGIKSKGTIHRRMKRLNPTLSWFFAWFVGALPVTLRSSLLPGRRPNPVRNRSQKPLNVDSDLFWIARSTLTGSVTFLVRLSKMKREICMTYPRIRKSSRLKWGQHYEMFAT